MWSHTACGIETPSITHVSDVQIAVTCDLIPLAVLKLACDKHHGISALVVTCDLIPLAVLKPESFTPEEMVCSKSHVISYRLRYWNGYRLMPMHADYLVTCDLIPLAVLKPSQRTGLPPFSFWSHVISYRLRYWTLWDTKVRSYTESSHVISYRLRYWNLAEFNEKLNTGVVTCDLIPLAVLKLI